MLALQPFGLPLAALGVSGSTVGYERRRRLSNVCVLASRLPSLARCARSLSDVFAAVFGDGKSNAHRYGQDRPVLGRVKAVAKTLRALLASRYAGLEFDLCARREGWQAKGGGVAF